MRPRRSSPGGWPSGGALAPGLAAADLRRRLPVAPCPCAAPPARPDPRRTADRRPTPNRSAARRRLCAVGRSDDAGGHRDMAERTRMGTGHADERGDRGGRLLVRGALATALARRRRGWAPVLTAAAGASPSTGPSGCAASDPHLTVQGSGQGSGTPDVLTAVFGFSSTASSSSRRAEPEQRQGRTWRCRPWRPTGWPHRDTQTTGLNSQRSTPTRTACPPSPAIRRPRPSRPRCATRRRTGRPSTPWSPPPGTPRRSIRSRSRSATRRGPGRGADRGGAPGGGARQAMAAAAGRRLGRGVLADRRHAAGEPAGAARASVTPPPPSAGVTRRAARAGHPGRVGPGHDGLRPGCSR